MIRVLDADLNRVGIIRNAIKASRVEQLNGENTLSFEAILDASLNEHIHVDTVFELHGDYFDLVMYEKQANDDGTYTVEVEAEQVSYRLNNEEYNLTDFMSRGTPLGTLMGILHNTGFTVGEVEPDDEIVYESGGEVSRRQLLMQFATAVKGELVFDKFTIGLVKHRGSTDRIPVVKDQHVKVISYVVDKRNILPNGNYQTAYTCESLFQPNDRYMLGDDAKLMDRQLNVWEDTRVVGIAYNPYDSMETTITFANGPAEYYSRGIERAIEEQVPPDTSEAVEEKVEHSLKNNGLLLPEGGASAQALIRVSEKESKWGNFADIHGLVIMSRLPTYAECENKEWHFSNDPEDNANKRSWEINDIVLVYNPDNPFIPESPVVEELE